jgi:flagellin-specific chaperone FliS
MNALNHDLEEAKEITTGLRLLYQFCQDQMRKGNTDIVSEILTTLKETWISAFNKEAIRV